MNAVETQPPPMMRAEPQKQHRWLQKLVGEWIVEEAAAQPEQSAETYTGTETVRSIGGLWIIAEGRGAMPGGGEATTVMTLGYDPEKDRFVGTWIGSMMTYLWVYDGELDVAERVLTLNAVGPDMSGSGRMASYQDIIEIRDDDHRLFRSQMLGEDGRWQPLMRSEYRRKK